MSLLFETIKVVDGIPYNLDYHNARLNRSRRAIFGCADDIELRDVIHIPVNIGGGKVKCRVECAEAIVRIEFTRYQRREIRSLSLVECDSIEYEHKLVDRTSIDSLLQGAATDDILIVKHGRITDASFANVVFYDGVKWITPSTPLLSGTARARLLDTRAIEANEIKKSDLRLFTKVALINAMVDFEETRWLDIDAVV